MINNEHTSKQFDAELEAVRARVLQMGGLVERHMQLFIEMMADGNTMRMNGVIDDGRSIHVMDVEINESCNQIIARRQPTAGDLRMVMAVIKAIGELERIASEIKKIAYMAMLLAQKDRMLLPRYADIRYAAEMALEMLRKSLDAFARLDLGSAAQVIHQDEIVDEKFRAIMCNLIACMVSDPRSISIALEILFVAKALERIGDHARNMYEHVVYMIKGHNAMHVIVDEIERRDAAEISSAPGFSVYDKQPGMAGYAMNTVISAS